MAIKRSDGLLKLTANPNFQPKHRDPLNKIRVQLKPRTQHERARVHGDSGSGIKARVGMPKSCPACLTEDEIDEVLEENQWWWHCRICNNKWDPVTKK